MNDKALSKLWGFFSVISLTLSILSWLRITGLTVKTDDFGFLSKPPVETTILTFPILALLIIGSLWLANHYRHKFGGSSWAERFPLFYFEKTDIDVATKDGHTYQGFCFVLFLVVPLVCLLVVYVKFLSGSVYCGNPVKKIFDQVTLFPIHSEKCVSFYRYASDNGPQYYLWSTPWIYLSLFLGSIAYWIKTIYRIFSGRN